MATLIELLRKNLTPEQHAQVMDALGDDFDFDLVPRSRLNKVIKQRNELREQLAGKSQNPEIDDDDEGAGAPAGKSTGGTSDDIKAMQKQHKTEMANLAIRYSALDKLRAAKAKDPELILKAGLLDTKGAKVADDGTVTWPDGENDPFTALTKNESYKYLFDGEAGNGGAGKGSDDGDGEGDDGVPAGTGKKQGAGDDGGKDQLDAMLDQAMGMASGITPIE